MRAGAALLLAGLLSAGPAAAQGLVVTPTPDGITLHNPGRATIVALRIGDEGRLARLGPGETVPLEAPADALLAGRFDPATWGAALDDLAPGWADTHLRTAGHFLDTIDAGPAGDPSRAANLRVLAAVDRDRVATWIGPSALRLALVARAARHIPPDALDPLLAAVDPGVSHAPWPSAYAALPPLADGVRRALEEHGGAAVPALRRAPRWAADRGFDAVLFAAFGLEPMPAAPPDGPAALERALAAGDYVAAARLAARLPQAPARARCGALDTAAQQAMREGRLAAAEGWLRLAGPLCGEGRASRDRAASLFRRRGDQRLQRGDLTGALPWYTAAFWLAEAPEDRFRLADTHADLALLRFGEGDFETGDGHLDAARGYDALRPRVQEAMEGRPTADPRARVGIAIIILLLTVFAVRRLRKLWRRDPPPDDRRRITRRRPTLKARRGPW